MASSPKVAKRVKRHIPPPPITRPGGQYESEDEQVLKGPKVDQLLRTVIKLRDGHKELSDSVAELTLQLKSVKDDYDTLSRGLGVKIERLEKREGQQVDCTSPFTVSFGHITTLLSAFIFMYFPSNCNVPPYLIIE